MGQDKECGGSVSECAAGMYMYALGYADSREALSMEGQSHSSLHLKNLILIKTALFNFAVFWVGTIIQQN